jgi:hypothetical protein
MGKQLYNTNRTLTRTDHLGRNNLNIANRDPAECSCIPPGTSFIDVTAVGDKTNIAYWDYLNQPSMSDHPYIIFGLTLTTQQRRRNNNRTKRRTVPPADQIDQTKFFESLKGTTDLPLASNEITPISKRETTTANQRKIFEEEVEKLTADIQQAAKHSRTRNVEKTSQAAVKPFWNEKLHDLRKKCRAAYTVVAESLYTLCSNIRLFTLYWRIVLAYRKEKGVSFVQSFLC